MKINVNKILKAVDGTDLEILDKKKDAKPGALVKLKLRSICVDALCNAMDRDKDMTGTEKKANWDLAGKIQKAKNSCELTVKEVAKLQDRIGKMYGPIIVGPAYDILESK